MLQSSIETREQAMVAQAQKSDAKVKAEDFLCLALKFAHKYRPRRAREEIRDTEVYSIACEHLIRSAAVYDSGPEDFPKFAWRFMRNGYFQTLRAQARIKRSANLSRLSEAQWASIAETSEADRIYDLLPLVFKESKTECRVDKEDRQLVVDHYINKKKVNHLAEALGVSRMTVHSRMQRCLRKLKSQYERELGG